MTNDDARTPCDPNFLSMLVDRIKHLEDRCSHLEDARLCFYADTCYFSDGTLLSWKWGTCAGATSGHSSRSHLHAKVVFPTSNKHPASPFCRIHRLDPTCSSPQTTLDHPDEQVQHKHKHQHHHHHQVVEVAVPIFCEEVVLGTRRLSFPREATTVQHILHAINDHMDTPLTQEELREARGFLQQHSHCHDPTMRLLCDALKHHDTWTPRMIASSAWNPMNDILFGGIVWHPSTQQFCAVYDMLTHAVASA